MNKNKMSKPSRADAMIESEKRYRTLVETMGDGLSEINEKQQTTYANDRLCEMWGYSREEIIGKNVTEFLDPENRKILARQMKKRRKGIHEPYEIAWTRKDGQILHTIMTPTPYFNKQGEFKGSFAVITDISEQKMKQRKLKMAHNELECSVAERTRELRIKTKSLEEVNTALRVLLKKREEDKKELEERMLLNVRELIMPFFEKLKRGKLNQRQNAYVEIIQDTLNNIVSPFMYQISSKYSKLTPSEIQVAHLVKNGNTTKEIADILNLSHKTIASYRKSIRRKIGITNQKVNLRTHLAVTL